MYWINVTLSTTFLVKNLANKEKQKRHLACMMTYGRDMPETPHVPKVHKMKQESQPPANINPIDDRK